MQDYCKGCDDRYGEICPLPTRMQRFLARLGETGQPFIPSFGPASLLAPLVLHSKGPEDSEVAQARAEERSQRIAKAVEICVLNHLFADSPDEPLPTAG